MGVRKEMIKHWHSFKNPLINDVLVNLEKLEGKQVQLSEETEQQVGELLKACETSPADKVDEARLIQLLNRLPAAYMLYIIHKLQNSNNELIMKVISYAQGNKDKDAEIMRFYQRNMVFEKAQLLGRIFSNKRMDSVIAIMMKQDSRASV